MLRRLIKNSRPSRFAGVLVALAIIGSVLIPTNTNAIAPPDIQWAPCEGAPAGRDCGVVTVPRDYANPTAGTYDLQVARSKATDTANYKGILLYLPGGPAQTGAWTIGYNNLSATFSPEVLAKFDIIGYNQFGVPEGVPCLTGNPLQEYWEMDHTPDGSLTKATQILEKEKQYNQGCVQNGGPLVLNMHTARTVQDVESIRHALAVSKVSIWSTSYGTAIAHNYMAKYPGRVTSAVLDSVADRTKTDQELFLENTKAFETTWTYFKAWCQQQPTSICGLKGQNIDAVLASTLATARTSPIPGPHAPTGPRAANDWMIAFSMMWATSAGVPNYRLADAILRQAAAGDASWAVYIYDSSTGRTTDANGNVMYVGGTGERRAISCNDSRWSQLLSTPQHVQNLVTEAKKIAPAYGEAAVYQGPAQCYKWPLAPKAPAPIDGTVTVGPKVLLVSGSLDAFTPLNWAQHVQSQIAGSKLLVRKGVTLKEEGTGHGNVYYSACVKQAQSNLLLNGTLPANGAICLSDASAHTPIEPPILGVTGIQGQKNLLQPFSKPE